ncbi:MAG: hypothetical protein WAM91_11240 [Candidatus Acidiferrales bacterium]
MKYPRSHRLPAFFMACLLCGISISSALAVDVPNKKEIVTKARQSYYNLHELGLTGFRCDVNPNWDLAAAEVKKTDPAAAANALKNMSMLRISMSVGADNNAIVTKTELPGADPQTANDRDVVFGGIRQMITGFYQTTSVFILGNPFPEVNGEYQLEDQAGQYRLAYRDSGVTAVIFMDKDLIISKMDITSTEFTSTLTPQFIKNPKGLLLTGYVATYKGKTSADDIKLNVQITYQDVSGLQLPQKLNVSGTVSGTYVAQEIGFSGCQVTRK